MVDYQKCASPEFKTVFKFLDRFGAFASIFHLTAISIERYIAVVKPYVFQQLPRKLFFGVSIFAWSLSLFMASLTWVSVPYVHAKFTDVIVCVFGFVIPAIIVISMYLGIFQAAKSLMKRTPALHQHNHVGLREDHKVAVTAAVISGLFIVAWLPFFLLSVIILFCPVKCLPGKYVDVLRMVSAVKWLHYSNSVINPIIYAFRDEEMRSSFKRILRIEKLRTFVKKPCRNIERHDRSSSCQETSVQFLSASCNCKKFDNMQIQIQKTNMFTDDYEPETSL